MHPKDETLGTTNDLSNSMSLFFSRQLPSEEEAEVGPQVSSDAPPPYSSIAADNAGMAHLHVILLMLQFLV